MKKNLLLVVALTTLVAGVHAETTTQSTQLQNTAVGVIGTPKITASEGQSIHVNSKRGVEADEYHEGAMGEIEHGGLSSGVTSGMEGAAAGPGSQGGQGCKGTCPQADQIGK